jgi:hypothetical protein
MWNAIVEKIIRKKMGVELRKKFINENLTVPMAHVPTGWYSVKAQCLAMHSR